VFVVEYSERFLILDKQNATADNEIDQLLNIDHLVVHQEQDFELGEKREYSVRTTQGQTLYNVSEENSARGFTMAGSSTMSGVNSDRPFLEMDRLDNCSCCFGQQAYMNIVHNGELLGQLKQTRYMPLAQFRVLNAVGDTMVEIKMLLSARYSPTIMSVSVILF
jgi:hypothetical protein